MHIDTVDRFEAFAALREDWDAAYAADPEAHLFISWLWFEKWLRLGDDGWFVLAAKPEAGAPHHVAFLPLRVVDRQGEDGGFYNEIQPACGFADCTGLICPPAFEAEALAAFGAHLGRLAWARLDLDGMRISKRRVSLLLAPLPANATETELTDRHVQNGIDLAACPYVDLPGDWESYLARCLSANSRQKVRRLLRRVEGDGSFRITHADAGTIERDLGILLGLWAARWGARKSSRLNAILNTARLMLLHCFERGALFLPVLWKDGKPVAALAILRDMQKKAVLFWIGGRDQDFDELPPAFVLHAYSIRHAITHGFRAYELLRGDEPYKYSFATNEHRLMHLLVTTRDRRNLGGKLLRRSLPFVFERSLQLHRKGRLDEAETGYRQMLAVEPRSGDALYGLGQIQAARGDHAAAVDTFKTYVTIRTTSPKGWFRLGLSLDSLGEHAAAEAAFAEVVRREPGHAAAARRLREGPSGGRE